MGTRLLREAFPALGAQAVDGYLRRAEERTPRVAAERSLPAPPAAPGSPAEATPTVLLVDDEADLRDIMRRMLERRGFHTLLAADAYEALQVCRNSLEVIDFVVTDAGLPSVTDHEFAGALTAAQPGARMVFVSGLPPEMAVRENLVAADAIVVKKPFSAETLVDALREALGSSANRPS